MTSLPTLHATALTTRPQNPFFRQKQLKALHDALRNSQASIAEAISSDSGASQAEAALELAAALNAVKAHYTAIDPKRELADENRIARSEDAERGRKAWGVVYIEPAAHTGVFSLVAGVSAAVAGGNCVAVRLENNLRATPALLRTLLTQALEPDTLALVASTPAQEELDGCLRVLQQGAAGEARYGDLVSPGRKVVAIVDRTADLAAAAQSVVTARYAFGGTSPYAADVVLVNEFVRERFVDEMRRCVGVCVGEKGGDAVLELPPLDALPPKSPSPTLAISAITSLEHAIGLLDEDAEPLLAGYYFGTPATGKYLSQFVRADVAFVNHIPHALLLGPAAPEYHGVDVGARYRVEQFTRAAPAFIKAGEARVLGGRAAEEALREAAREIREKKRAEWIAIGYFEQGILIGLGLVGVPLLTCIGTGLFWGVRAGLRRFAFI